MTNQLRNQHLLWRAAFGPMAKNVNEIDKVSQAQLYELLLKTSSGKPVPLIVAHNSFDGLVKGVTDLGKLQNLSNDEKKILRKKSAEDLKNLNLVWLSEMVNSESQFREKMALFWHGHFACRVINIFFQQQLLNTIRENALGNFGDLIREVSKSPAMLSFLNNQQNKKQHPNENFARELMELFTLGRGHYTETDVKEAARAFTGWGFNATGEFVNRPFFHDNGSKEFLGYTGNFNGDDIIDILLEQKQTATFITSKIYRYFVNENVDANTVDLVAEKFYNSNYNMQVLFDNIYKSAWFYAEKNIGIKIKSPIELIAGLRRFLPMQIDRPEIQILLQRALGQLLFYPPNVAGWPGGRNWIDSSTLLLRMRIPKVLTRSDEFGIKPKDDDDAMMGKESTGGEFKLRQLNVIVAWKSVLKVFDNTAEENLAKNLEATLIQSRSKINPAVLAKYCDAASRESFIKSAIVELMSTPEYQLC